MALTTYDVNVERGDKYWLVRVPAIDRVTQARHLREVEAMARDLIAIMTDRDSRSFDLRIDIALPPSVQGHLEHAAELRADAAAAQAEAAAELRAAARELRDTGMAVRDVGAALGVSHQRAHQLIHA